MKISIHIFFFFLVENKKIKIDLIIELILIEDKIKN